MLEHSIQIDSHILQNRVVLQPMEGCDCDESGTPSELTVQKYLRAAKSGAGLIWMEATAVCPEGRTNLHQMMLTKENLPIFRALVEQMRRTSQEECGIRPVILLQLTHSGRQSVVPMIAYRHPIYEATRPMTDEQIVSDEYLDTLPALYAEAAKLAVDAGFDGVDVKSCHGYLLQELLSAFSRDGRYGGCFENRARLYLNCVRAVKKVLPATSLLTTRLSVSDMVPKPYGFGTDEENVLDFTEPDLLLARLIEEGVRILNVTIGNPYYNPHINRPFRKGNYIPPEPAQVGLDRFITIEKHIKDRFPATVLVGSGMSYYRDNLMEQSEKLLREGVCDLVGYGRLWLAYPMFYRDHLNGTFQAKRCCLTCSRCTTLMRNKLPSGCAVFDPTYKALYDTI